MSGMTLPQFRVALRTDLKDTGTDAAPGLWTTAELNRSVLRAVEDFSRFMPLQKVYELTTDFTVTDESVTTPAAASATAIIIATTLNGVSSGGTLTPLTDNTPDVPRRLTVTLTDANASVTALTIIVKGYDKDGYYIEESWFLKDLPTTVAVQGKEYFKYVSTVEVNNIAGTAAAGDTISVGTGNAYDSFISLANKPIRSGSVTVTNAAGTTTYALDTDYTIDYINGRIKFINGGSMAAGTAYLVDYTKSRLGIDISSIIPVLTRITNVEYPADQVPQQFVSFNIFGDFMYVGSQRTGKSQEEMSEDKHIAIYYERRHTSPGEVGPGSHPESMDEVVVIGAGAYCLLVEALQYEQQAATDLTSLRTELGLTTAVHTALTTALGKVDTYLATKATDNAYYWLSKITTDIAGLRTALLAAVDAATTALGKVSTVDLDAATVGSVAWLLEGELKIDAVNTGANVAELFAAYARAKSEGNAGARINSAMAYIQEAATRLGNLRSYLEQSAAFGNIAAGFVAEAQAEIAELDRYLAEANAYAEAVNGDLVLADRFKAEGLERLNEFYAILKSKAEWRRKVSVVPVHQPA